MSYKYHVPYTFDFKQDTVPSEHVNQNNSYIIASLNQIAAHSASVTVPSDPMEGEIWMDKNETPSAVRIYNGTIFEWFGTMSGLTAPSNPREGALYYREDLSGLYVYTDGAWVEVAFATADAAVTTIGNYKMSWNETLDTLDFEYIG